ncbi:MAG: PQQ-like beta-propeller repeat protein [Planctomycetes bacterium]|nr:PQQ-like beta-propeller repeat protein [Planctomycetota bacterium]
MKYVNYLVTTLAGLSARLCPTAKRSASTAVLLLGLFLGLVAVKANERTSFWPNFHGPNRDNISRETGLLSRWPDGGPKLIWKFSGCGRGYSGVSLADGMILTAGDFNDVEMVIALDMNGCLLWKSPNGKSWTGPQPGSRTTPTYSEGVLYQMNPTGRLAAFHARSGEELWAVDLRERFGAKYGIWAMSENVIVEGDHVFCVPGGSKALVAALDKHTGETVWTNTGLQETAAYCTPALVTHEGVDTLVTLTQKSVIGVDARTGKLLWSHPHVTRRDQNITTPVFSDGYVFAASGHSGGGRLVKINGEDNSTEEIWWKEELDNCHGGVIFEDGYIYGSACRKGGKGFFCVEFLTGDIRYLKKMEKLSLTCADGMLYGLSQQGKVMLIEYGPDKFEIASSFELPKPGKMPAFAHPVVCGGRLYLRQGENLFAYDVRGSRE